MRIWITASTAPADLAGLTRCTPGTAICTIVLPDSAHVQEDEHANEHGYGEHQPSLPLHSTGCGANLDHYGVSC